MYFFLLFFTFLITTILIIPCWSQIESNPWSFPKYKQALSTSKNIPQQHTVVQLKEKVLVDILDRAPLRFSEEAKQNTTFITLPLGDGTLQEFIIEEGNKEIDLSHLENGIYYLLIGENSHNPFIIIVQK